MKFRLAIVLFFLTVAIACTIGKERPARTFDEATGAEGLERMFWKDVQAGSWVEIERILASNYVGTAPGALLDRTATLDQLRTWKVTDYSIGEMRTELNGPTFIVTYSITLKGTAAEGQPLPAGPQHMMSVWHQHKSGWMLIAHSASQP